MSEASNDLLQKCEKWLDGVFVTFFRFFNFRRFLYDKTLQNSDFFEETLLKIARFAEMRHIYMIFKQCEYQPLATTQLQHASGEKTGTTPKNPSYPARRCEDWKWRISE